MSLVCESQPALREYRRRVTAERVRLKQISKALATSKSRLGDAAGQIRRTATDFDSEIRAIDKKLKVFESAEADLSLLIDPTLRSDDEEKLAAKSRYSKKLTHRLSLRKNSADLRRKVIKQIENAISDVVKILKIAPPMQKRIHTFVATFFAVGWGEKITEENVGTLRTRMRKSRKRVSA